jgi:hypothetical protein
MGELYQKMERDLAVKNLAPVTRKEYLRCCCKFVRYHMRSPREMGVSEIKDFLGQLVREGAGPETLKMHVAGVKCLYDITLEGEGGSKCIFAQAPGVPASPERRGSLGEGPCEGRPERDTRPRARVPRRDGRA